MNYEYKYVFMGVHTPIVIKEKIQNILKEGWEPVRETALHDGNGNALLVLRKEKKEG